MADVGVPHTGSLPNSFVGNDARAGVGEPGFLGVSFGVPHFAPSLANTWTGGDSRANVGQPNNLGAAIGVPNP